MRLKIWCLRPLCSMKFEESKVVPAATTMRVCCETRKRPRRNGRRSEALRQSHGGAPPEVLRGVALRLPETRQGRRRVRGGWQGGAPPLRGIRVCYAAQRRLRRRLCLLRPGPLLHAPRPPVAAGLTFLALHSDVGSGKTPDATRTPPSHHLQTSSRGLTRREGNRHAALGLDRSEGMRSGRGEGKGGGLTGVMERAEAGARGMGAFTPPAGPAVPAVATPSCSPRPAGSAGQPSTCHTFCLPLHYTPSKAGQRRRVQRGCSPSRGCSP